MPDSRPAGLAPFFLFTFAWSWIFFFLAVPQLRAHPEGSAGPWPLVALLLGAWGPSLTALALTARAGGGPAVRSLLAGFGAWRGRWGWHGAALLLTAALGLPAILLWAYLGGGQLALDLDRARWIPVAVLAAVPFGPLGEEIGWRGFAQPRLLERYGPLATGVVLGLAWTAWHAPLFLSPVGSSISGEPITPAALAGYAGSLVGLSILIALISLRTGTPLLTGFLVHLGFNAEIYRFVFELPGQRSAIERWALVPMAVLVVVLLIARWRAAGRGAAL